MPSTPIPTFVAATFGDWTHYYHVREDAILPKDVYDERHPGQCVLPLRRVPAPVSTPVVRNAHQETLDRLRQEDLDRRFN